MPGSSIECSYNAIVYLSGFYVAIRSPTVVIFSTSRSGIWILMFLDFKTFHHVSASDWDRFWTRFRLIADLLTLSWLTTISTILFHNTSFVIPFGVSSNQCFLRIDINNCNYECYYNKRNNFDLILILFHDYNLRKTWRAWIVSCSFRNIPYSVIRSKLRFPFSFTICSYSLRLFPSIYSDNMCRTTSLRKFIGDYHFRFRYREKIDRWIPSYWSA